MLSSFRPKFFFAFFAAIAAAVFQANVMQHYYPLPFDSHLPVFVTPTLLVVIAFAVAAVAGFADFSWAYLFCAAGFTALFLETLSHRPPSDEVLVFAILAAGTVAGVLRGLLQIVHNLQVTREVRDYSAE